MAHKSKKDQISEVDKRKRYGVKRDDRGSGTMTVGIGTKSQREGRGTDPEGKKGRDPDFNRDRIATYHKEHDKRLRGSNNFTE